MLNMHSHTCMYMHVQIYEVVSCNAQKELYCTSNGTFDDSSLLLPYHTIHSQMPVGHSGFLAWWGGRGQVCKGRVS